MARSAVGCCSSSHSGNPFPGGSLLPGPRLAKMTSPLQPSAALSLAASSKVFLRGAVPEGASLCLGSQLPHIGKILVRQKQGSPRTALWRGQSETHYSTPAGPTRSTTATSGPLACQDVLAASETFPTGPSHPHPKESVTRDRQSTP